MSIERTKKERENVVKIQKVVILQPVGIIGYLHGFCPSVFRSVKWDRNKNTYPAEAW